MILYNSVDEINPLQWKELIDQSTTATFFQTRECFDFYNSLSFLKPFLYGVSENDTLVGILCGYIIAEENILKRFFSRRAIVPGGILLAPDVSEQAVKQLLDRAKNELARKAIYLEIRNYNDFTAFRPSIESAGLKYHPHLNFHLNTNSEDIIYSQLSSSKRRQIKQSLKNGAEIIENFNEQELKEYYSILEDLYKNKVKSPLFPLEFFIEFQKQRNSKIILIRYQEKIVGGIVCIIFRNEVVYEWFVCGNDGIDKNVFPSVLATWAGIEYAAKNNYRYFDFMGAGKPDEGYGVREFKSKFGGELLEHGRFLYICKPSLYRLGKFIVKKLKHK